MAELEQNAKSRKAPRWVKVLLAVSLAANLLIIGAVIGVGMRAKSFVGDGASGGPRGGIAFIAALERDDRRSVIGKTRDIRRQSREEGRAEMQQILTVLRAEPFDRVAFVELLEGQKNRNQRMQDTLGQELVTQIATMSAQERVAYADRVQEHLERGKKRSGKKDGKRDH